MMVDGFLIGEHFQEGSQNDQYEGNELDRYEPDVNKSYVGNWRKFVHHTE